MALVTQYLILKTLLVIELVQGLQAVILVKINSIHLWIRFLILNTALLVLLKFCHLWSLVLYR
uniref:Uncharacterized protein n=1 Tax=Oryza nivara TaxID=4536 RepID=A0A0E0HSZ6_ORYNI